jgi:hypothetical protein
MRVLGAAGFGMGRKGVVAWEYALDVIHQYASDSVAAGAAPPAVSKHQETSGIAIQVIAAPEDDGDLEKPARARLASSSPAPAVQQQPPPAARHSSSDPPANGSLPAARNMSSTAYLLSGLGPRGAVQAKVPEFGSANARARGALEMPKGAVAHLNAFAEIDPALVAAYGHGGGAGKAGRARDRPRGGSRARRSDERMDDECASTRADLAENDDVIPEMHLAAYAATRDAGRHRAGSTGVRGGVDRFGPYQGDGVVRKSRQRPQTASAGAAAGAATATSTSSRSVRAGAMMRVEQWRSSGGGAPVPSRLDPDTRLPRVPVPVPPTTDRRAQEGCVLGAPRPRAARPPSAAAGHVKAPARRPRRGSVTRAARSRPGSAPMAQSAQRQNPQRPAGSSAGTWLVTDVDIRAAVQARGSGRAAVLAARSPPPDEPPQCPHETAASSGQPKSLCVRCFMNAHLSRAQAQSAGAREESAAAATTAADAAAQTNFLDVNPEIHTKASSRRRIQMWFQD